MPQISPILWTLIVALFTLFLMYSMETLPEMNSLSPKKERFSAKSKEMKW